MQNDVVCGTMPNDNSGNEKCALCGAATDVPRSRPIDERDCYIYGAGQLCRKCFANIESGEMERIRNASKQY